MSSERAVRSALALVVLASVLLCPSRSRAGAWTREFSSYYAKISADYYSASGYVNPQTGTQTGNNFFNQQYSLYGEVGILPFHPV